jgi:glutaredoxin 3
MPPGSEGRRCHAHGLAAAPDGLCALCRRAPTAMPVAAVDDAASGGGLVTAVMALGLLMSLGGLGWAMSSDRGQAMSQAELGVSRHASRTVGLRGAVPPARAPQPIARSREPTRPTAAPSSTASSKTAEAAKSLVTQTEQSGLDAEARQRTAEIDVADRRRHAQIQAGLDTEALAAARRNVAIEMYSTSWCPACNAARQYFQTQNIAFTDHDVERDPEAQARADTLNPRHSIPVIDVGGEVMVGFSARTFEAKLDLAANRRLGR